MTDSGPSLGVGIITRNRLAILRQTIAELERLTTRPFALVVADDGSNDDTASWVRETSIPLVTGLRRGCAWNKNRALRHLAMRTAAGVFLLLEDDTRPTLTGWEREWFEAALRWRHVNYCYGFEPAKPPPGKGTTLDPYRCNAFGGHCTATTRAALEEVGYLDTRFRGYGWEHVERTWRFQLRYADEWGPPTHTVPCLDHGVCSIWPPSFYDQAEVDRNEAIYASIRNAIDGPYRRDPWRDNGERLTLER
jgi:GT2 family glycosyltransferase